MQVTKARETFSDTFKESMGFLQKSRDSSAAQLVEKVPQARHEMQTPKYYSALGKCATRCCAFIFRRIKEAWRTDSYLDKSSPSLRRLTRDALLTCLPSAVYLGPQLGRQVNK